ncbi:MAG: 50S ribosomal protein L34e [Acidilobaceae archaeon]
MVRPALRSRSWRRVYRRTPGGETIVHFERRRPGKPTCWRCGRPLGGVPRGFPYEIRGFARSKRRPNRPYGGYLCSTCLAELLSKAVVRGGL